MGKKHYRYYFSGFLLASICLMGAFTFSGISIGQKAPEFSVNGKDGKKYTLESFKGRVVLIDFWASWCGPCREINPDLVQIYKAFKDRGFEIISISLDKKPEAWNAAIKKDQLIWPAHSCDLKEWESPVVKTFQVDAVPTSFLINEEGKVIEIDVDPYYLPKVLEKYFAKTVKVYPKAASNRLFFTNEVKYDLINAEGKSVLKGTFHEVNIKSLPEGEYTIKYGDKKEKVRKIAEKESVAISTHASVEDHYNMARSCKYEVYNTRGYVVLQGEGAQISMKELPSGVYHVNMEGHSEKVFKK